MIPFLKQLRQKHDVSQEFLAKNNQPQESL